MVWPTVVVFGGGFWIFIFIQTFLAILWNMSIFLWLQSVQWWRIKTNKLFFPNSLPNMLLLTCMDKIYIHSYKKIQPELSKVMRYWSLSIASLTIFTTRPNAGILTSGIERPQTPVRNAGWKSKALPCYSLVALMSSLAWNLSAVLPAKQLQPPKKVCTVLHFVLFLSGPFYFCLPLIS